MASNTPFLPSLFSSDDSMMIFRIVGGLWFLLEGLTQIGVVGVPGIVLGILAIIAAAALFAGR